MSAIRPIASSLLELDNLMEAINKRAMKEEAEADEEAARLEHERQQKEVKLLRAEIEEEEAARMKVRETTEEERQRMEEKNA